MGAVAGLLAVVMGALGGLLHAANAAADRVHAPSFWFLGFATAVAYGAVAVLLRRSPAAWVRRLSAIIGTTAGIALLAREWAWLGDVPLAGLALWLGSWLWVVSYVAILAVLPHVLPDGQLTSPRWRPAVWLSAATAIAAAVAWATTPYDRQDFPHQLRDLVNPIGHLFATHPLVVATVGALLCASTLLAAASLVVRWRRSTGPARQQLKWLLLGVAATVLLAVLARALPAAPVELAGLAMLPIPAALALAVLRFGLWEVDVVISRSITYVTLSAAAVVVYLSIVWLLGSLLDVWTGAPVLATVAAALVALPLHARLQRWVNLRVHGDVEEPHAALARVGERLAAASDPQSLWAEVLPGVARQLATALRAASAEFALVDGTTVRYGPPIPAGSRAGVVRVPLSYGGVRSGELAVRRLGGFDEADILALDRLAAQAGVAAHTVLLAHEVQRAREATIVAREEERRQLRRDLHDDIGPALAAIALQAETALRPSAGDGQAQALLARLVPRLNAAVADLRALVHDLRPPDLDEFGLAASLRELAARLSTDEVSVRVDASAIPSMSAALDVAAYRIVAEAVTNAVRHARAREVLAQVSADDRELLISVRDDGVGMAPEREPGLGLSSMRLRAEELGGQLRITTGSEGTRIQARIPLAPTSLGRGVEPRHAEHRS